VTLEDRLSEIDSDLEWWRETAVRALRDEDWEQLQEAALVLLRIEGVQEMLRVLLREKNAPLLVLGSNERMTLPPCAFDQGPESP
jgi:hypothetical protein